MQGGIRRTAARAQGRVSPRALSRPAPAAYALALVAAAVLAGCGGGSSTPSSSSSSSSVTPGSPVASTQASPASTNAVALVQRTPIPKASYTHWLSVERALGSGAAASHRALGFLITSTWVQSEAATRGISASEAEAKSRLAQLEHQDFPKAGSLKKFLATSAQPEADLLWRTKVELLESRIAAKVTAGKRAPQSKSALAS